MENNSRKTNESTSRINNSHMHTELFAPTSILRRNKSSDHSLNSTAMLSKVTEGDHQHPRQLYIPTASMYNGTQYPIGQQLNGNQWSRESYQAPNRAADYHHTLQQGANPWLQQHKVPQINPTGGYQSTTHEDHAFPSNQLRTNQFMQAPAVSFRDDLTKFY